MLPPSVNSLSWHMFCEIVKRKNSGERTKKKMKGAFYAHS
jgi:hypothetical protein